MLNITLACNLEINCKNLLYKLYPVVIDFTKKKQF